MKGIQSVETSSSNTKAICFWEIPPLPQYFLKSRPVNKKITAQTDVDMSSANVA